jgi:transcriptional regulator with XRE-family HTH domain
MAKLSNIELNKKIGNNIRNKRKMLNMSLNDLAKAVNLTPGFLGLIERGHRGGSIDSLLDVMNALHMNFSELIGEPKKDKSDVYKQTVSTYFKYLDEADKEMVIDLCVFLKKKNNRILQQQQQHQQ